MDKKTLKALKGSIKKWEEIAYNNGEDKGPLNCPLCKLFFKDMDDIYSEIQDICCINCPIFEKTGLKYCENTPYDAWNSNQEHGIYIGSYVASTPELKEIAIQEVDFLKSLLPNDVK